MDEDWLRIFEAKALAEALTEAGHSVSERTAQRWKKKETRPKPQDVRAIRELVGAIAPDAKKNTPAEAGAAEELLRRWLGNDPPPWANALTAQIVSAIEGDRQAVVSAAIEAAVDGAERRLFEGSDPEAETPPTDPPPATGGGRPRPEA